MNILSKIRNKTSDILERTFPTEISFPDSGTSEGFMAEVTMGREYESLRDKFDKQAALEKKFVEQDYGYVKWNGVTYRVKSSNGALNFRESFVDERGLNSRMRFSLDIIDKYIPKPSNIYLTESGTPYHRVIQQTKGNVLASHFKPGAENHQDLTALTLNDDSFELCLCFEDLEHIPDYKAVLRELARVTKKDGYTLLSTPFRPEMDTLEVRASVDTEGNIIHHMTPEYHGDPVKGNFSCLAYYYFGWHLLEELKEAGFSEVKAIVGYDISKLMLGQLIFILARK